MKHGTYAGIPSASELQARLRAQRAGAPFLAYRNRDGAEVIVPLPEAGTSLSIGRGASNGLCLDWDPNVSRVHAEIVCIGEERAIVDDGLSRNGSFVNGERVSGRRRLRLGDVLTLGATQLRYWAPHTQPRDSTAMASDIPAAAALSPAQRRVLIALARPFHQATGLPIPATNRAIAAELYLGIDAVKFHLRALSVKFGVQDLPQNEKRARLVERALASGAITPRDLDPGKAR